MAIMIKGPFVIKSLLQIFNFQLLCVSPFSNVVTKMWLRYSCCSYACLVAFAAHICVALHDGITRALGVMLPTLVEEFDTDITTIGSVIALMAAVGSIASKDPGGNGPLTLV